MATKIKKKSEEVKYKKITKLHEFEIGDRILKVSEYQMYDSVFEDYDSDIEVENKDDFTEEELEVIDDEMSDLLDLKEGEEIEVELEDIN